MYTLTCQHWVPGSQTQSWKKVPCSGFHPDLSENSFLQRTSRAPRSFCWESLGCAIQSLLDHSVSSLSSHLTKTEQDYEGESHGIVSRWLQLWMWRGPQCLVRWTGTHGMTFGDWVLHVKWSHTSGSPQKGELPFLRAWLSFPQCYGLDRLQILCSHFFKDAVISQLHSPLLNWSSSCQYPGGNTHRP